MLCARRRLRYVRRTSGPCLDAKRVGVLAGNQHYHTWLGKLGVKEQPLIGQFLSLAETTRFRAMEAIANFLAIDRGDIMYCAKELTRHMAAPNNHRLGAGGGFGKVFEKQTQGSVMAQVSRDAVPT